jgi:hypothetical protein
MPDPLGITLLVGIACFGVVAAIVVLNEIRKGSIWVAAQLTFQSPIVRRTMPAPDPNQWLLDIAQSDTDNPAEFLVILDSRVTSKDLSPKQFRPWIELGVELYNCNVHTVSVRGTTGYAKFNGKELPEPIDGSLGGSNKPRGHKHVYTMKQHLPPEVAAEVYQEMVDEVSACGGKRRKELRSLDLGGVSIEVECNGHTVPLGLGGVCRFRFD